MFDPRAWRARASGLVRMAPLPVPLLAVLALAAPVGASPNTHGSAVGAWDVRSSSVAFSGYANPLGRFHGGSVHANFSTASGESSAQFGVHYGNVRTDAAEPRRAPRLAQHALHLPAPVPQGRPPRGPGRAGRPEAVRDRRGYSSKQFGRSASLGSGRSPSSTLRVARALQLVASLHQTSTQSSLVMRMQVSSRSVSSG